MSKVPFNKETCLRTNAAAYEIKAKQEALRKVLNIVFLVIVLIVLIFSFDVIGIGDNTSRVMLAGLLLVSIWLFTLRNEKILKRPLMNILM